MVEHVSGSAAASGRRWWGLVAISVAVSLIIVDSTIVNVAVPYLVKDLALTSSEVQWVQESYTLVFAATLLLWGTLADRIGRRRMLLLGLAVFVFASVLAAIAATGGELIGARIIQGIGGAMILPTTLSLINAGFTGRERGIAFAVWGSTIGGVVALGPLLGGWLTTSFSWRWAFGINLPLGLLVAVGILLFVAESKGKAVHGIDIVGALMSAITFAALAFGLIEGRTYGWWTTVRPLEIGSWSWTATLSPVPIALALSMILGTAFVLRTIRRTRAGLPTLLRFELFGIPSFRNGNIAAMIVSLGEFGIILSLPLWLQNVLGYTAFQTGLVLLGLAVGSFAASGLSAALSGRLTPASIVRAGLVAEIVGVTALGVTVSPSASWLVVVGALAVYGFGVGLATAQLTGVVLVDVPVQRSGEASGVQSTSRQIGSALGIAILGTVLFTSVGAQLDASLREANVPDAARTSIVAAVVDSAGGAIPSLVNDPSTAVAYEPARQAFSDGTRYAAFTAAGFLLIGLAASFSLGSGRRRNDWDGEADEAKAGSQDVGMAEDVGVATEDRQELRGRPLA